MIKVKITKEAIEFLSHETGLLEDDAIDLFQITLNMCELEEQQDNRDNIEIKKFVNQEPLSDKFFNEIMSYYRNKKTSGEKNPNLTRGLNCIGRAIKDGNFNNMSFDDFIDELFKPESKVFSLRNIGTSGVEAVREYFLLYKSA